MDVATIAESAVKVLVAGLVFGVGLPALFAYGIRLRAQGSPRFNTNGTVTAGSPVAAAVGTVLFAVVGLVVLVAILWITRASLDHYLGVQLFGGA